MGNLREIFDEQPIEPYMSKEGSNLLDRCGEGGLEINSTLALSTSIPLSDTTCPKTIPSFTIK